MQKLLIFPIVITFILIENKCIAENISFDSLNYKPYIDSIKFYASKQPDKSIKLGKSLLNFLSQKNNPNELEKIYEGLAIANYYLSNKKEALLYLNLQRHILHQQNNSKKLSEVYNRIGAIFHEWSLLQEALDYFNKAYQYALKSNDQAVLAQTYNNLGLINKDQGNYDRAYEYFIKAKEIYLQLNDKRGLLIL